MKNNIVYMYVNKINNKIYIGRTSQTLKQRAGKNGVGYKTSCRFWNAICKYGWKNFDVYVLAQNVSFQESVEIERYYIDLYKTCNERNGYNILAQEPGQGKHSKETIQKMKIAQRELVIGIRKPKQKNKSMKRTMEHCKHLSESLKGNVPWNKGKITGPLKQETKDKMSIVRIGNKNSIHVSVKNINTGEVFRSGAEAGRSIGCTSEAIFAAIKNNKPCKGFMFERICG